MYFHWRLRSGQNYIAQNCDTSKNASSANGWRGPNILHFRQSATAMLGHFRTASFHTCGANVCQKLQRHCLHVWRNFGKIVPVNSAHPRTKLQQRQHICCGLQQNRFARSNASKVPRDTGSEIPHNTFYDFQRIGKRDRDHGANCIANPSLCKTRISRTRMLYHYVNGCI